MIHVVIPVYNRLEYTNLCLERLSLVNNDINIVVVNDGSTDETKEFLSVNWPHVVVLEGDGQLYWGGAIKIAVDYIESIACPNDWLITLNNDVMVEPETFTDLVNIATIENRKCLVGALCLDYDSTNKVVKSGTNYLLRMLNVNRHPFVGLSASEASSHLPLNVDLLVGRCLLHPVEVFTNVGNYNYELFPHYGADDEFTARAKFYNYKLILDPSNQVKLISQESYFTSNDSSGVKGYLQHVWFTLFSIKSSSRLINKWKLALSHVGHSFILPYLFVSILKSLYVALFRYK